MGRTEKDIKLYDFFGFFGVVVVCSKGYLVSLRKSAREGKKKSIYELLSKNRKKIEIISHARES
jgi:hypothetical protein